MESAKFADCHRDLTTQDLTGWGRAAYVASHGPANRTRADYFYGNLPLLKEALLRHKKEMWRWYRVMDCQIIGRIEIDKDQNENR